MTFQPKYLSETVTLFVNLYLTYTISQNKQDYPISLIVADVTLVLNPNEKNEKTCNKNYRPVSLISIVSKVFERTMFDEITQ